MRLGVIFCGYDCAELLGKSLVPWFKAKQKADIKVVGVHGLFKENRQLGLEDNDFKTQKELKTYLNPHGLDSLYLQNDYSMLEDELFETEAQIRHHGFELLAEFRPDYVTLWDGDEEADESSILKLHSFIQSEPSVAWFKIHYRNLIFSESLYSKDFAPPRIFKSQFGAWRLNGCYWDNDFDYFDNYGNRRNYDSFPYGEIPESVCNPLHWTWLDNERSKKKVNYQMKHFGHCGFKIDDTGHLAFNSDYYKKIGAKPSKLYLRLV